jgi:hypothetical protein
MSQENEAISCIVVTFGKAKRMTLPLLGVRFGGILAWWRPDWPFIVRIPAALSAYSDVSR